MVSKIKKERSWGNKTSIVADKVIDLLEVSANSKPYRSRR